MTQEELENIIYAYGRDLYSFCCSVTRNTQEAEGVISYEYEFEDGASGSGADYFDSLFPDSIVGTRTIRGYSYSDGGLKKLNINVFILNEDGTVTFVIYQPIL